MATNVRIEARSLPANASFEQKDRAFKGMFAAFKRQVNELGILTEHNIKSTYESRGQKVRRKKKESNLRREKEKALQYRLREYFGQG